jgi:molybdate transport system substrate-binding protein
MHSRFGRRSASALILAVLLVLLTAALVACGSESTETTDASDAATGGTSAQTNAVTTGEAGNSTTAGESQGEPQELLVSAAAGLKNAFTEIGTEFDKANNAKTVLNFAAAGTLQRQIEGGASADVFASADPKQMNALLDGDLVDAASVKTFASNDIVLVVPADSTLGIAGFEDLAKADVKKVATGNPDVMPLGAATLKILPALNIEDSVKPKLIYAETVNQTLQYVSSGEVEAGLLWTSEALAGGDKVKTVATADPDWYGGRPKFVIGTVSASQVKALDQAFIDFVLGPQGQAILEKHGFLEPEQA